MIQSKSILGLVGMANRSTDEDWSIIVDALRDIMVEKNNSTHLGYYVIGVVALVMISLMVKV